MEKHIKYKHGITGFVELHKKIAKKYTSLNYTYWIKEYSILLFLWPFRTDNIIKFHNSSFDLKIHPLTNVESLHYELVFDKYRYTLADYKIYYDKTILQIMIDITSALSFLHSLNIWHRDVKPENILIDKSERATIIDFSHAHRFIVNIDSLDIHVVTSYYRAPEVFSYAHNKKIPYNEKIDVWALGIILAEMITGKVFMHEVSDHSEEHIEYIVSDYVLFYKLLTHFYWYNKRNIRYADDYWTLIVKMTAFNPKDRISMVDAMNYLFLLSHKYNINILIPVNSTEPANAANATNEANATNAANEANATNADQLAMSDGHAVASGSHAVASGSHAVASGSHLQLSINDLLQKCQAVARIFNKNYNIIVVFAQIKKIIAHLIKNNVINNDNYAVYVLALMFIMDTFLYDVIIEIDKCIKPKNIIYIQTAIMEIVQQFDQDLFANGTFTYID